MKVELSEIAFVIIAGTLLFVFLIFIIISFFLVYQNRKKQIEIERQLEFQKYENELINAQNEIREETMRFISQELHDNIAQSLVVTHISFNNINDKSEFFKTTKASLLHTIDQVKLLSKALNTENILQGGLINSLNFEIERLRKLNRWKIDYFNEINIINLNQNHQILIFRIFQEIINNIIKHSGADSIVVESEINASNYILEIIDNGQKYDFENMLNNGGFDSGAGLKGILKKTQILKAKFEVFEDKNKNVHHKLIIPISDD